MLLTTLSSPHRLIHAEAEIVSLVSFFIRHKHDKGIKYGQVTQVQSREDSRYNIYDFLLVFE